MAPPATHASLLTELLSSSTRMPITEADQGAPLEPNHVYVIPPGTDMAVRDLRLELHKQEQG